MSTEANLQAGIAAVRRGDPSRAASYFAKVVKENPRSERGWYLLGTCLSDPEKREFCFRRVLTLNPNNSQAKKQLESLSKPAPPTIPPFYPPDSPEGESSGMSTPAAPPSAPLVESAQDEGPAPSEDSRIGPPEEPLSEEVPASWKDISPDSMGEPAQKEVPAPWEYSPPAPEDAAEEQPQRRPSNRSLYITTVIAAGLILCGIGAGILHLTGQLDRLLSVSFIGENAPPLSAGVITVTPFGPTATPTSTPDPSILPTPKPRVAYSPSFEESPCSFDVYADVDVRCGYLVVPEDRTGDPDQTIRLAVAVYSSFSDDPEPDPVLFLQGGPGSEAVTLSADAYYFLVEPFLSKRDFVVFDQRGTGLSEPSLQCDELTKTYSQDIRGLIEISTRELVYSNSFLSCEGLIRAQGINLNAYTTLESAADVKDLLEELEYQKANLYGASYGTRLAQVIMREYPEVVESAILDSVVPVESNLFYRYPDAIESGLNRLFTDCAGNQQCSAAYPNLETTFWELVTELDTNPVTVTTSNYPTGTITETVTGTTVMNIILGSIKNSNFISTAPQSIYRFKEGDFSTLVLAQSSLPFAFEGISPGLFISMMCHEHILTTSVEQLQSASDREIIKEFAWLPFYGDAENIFNTCKAWGATGPVVGENDPTVSDIPSLIITGAYDPTTPPLYGKQIAGQLSNHFYFEFPNLGHTPTAADPSGCALDIMLEFLDEPTIEPERTCLDEIDSIEFVVPYTGEPPLALDTVQAYGVSVDVPQDWLALGEGFYYRGNSPFDITEVAVLRIPGSSKEIEEWFSLPAYGYRGLDSPLMPAGQRQANGLSWKLFTSSSYGRPVDIAMVDDGGWSIVVIMFCNQDEHEALYNTVFLEMVDSATR